METIIAVLFFTFGLVAGSFVNALSFRYNSGKGMTSRSMCFSCGHPLSTLDLVPVVSFVLLGGKCRYCFSRISWQYFVVELLSGLMFLSFYFKLEGVKENPNLILLNGLAQGLFWSAFIFIALYDLKHKIVPNEAVYFMASIGAVMALFNQNYIQFLYALVIFAPFFLLWIGSGGRLMGLGDGKIAFALGIFLPISVSVSGIVLSFWIGALYAALLMILQKFGLNSTGKDLTIKSEIPFVPFMLIGSFTAYLFEMDILSLTMLF